MSESTAPNQVGSTPTTNPTDELLEMAQPHADAQPLPQFNSSAPAPRDLSAAAPAADLLAGLPPEPSKGGISESIQDQFRRQLAKNVNAMAAQNPQGAAAPGGWARALLGGAMNTLAGGGITLGSPSPGPLQSTGISGVQNALNANREKVLQNQDRATASKQRDFENELRMKQDQRAEEAHKAQVTMWQMATEQHKAAMSEAEQNQFHKDVVEPWIDAETKKGLEAGDITPVMGQDGLKQLAAQHKSADDPDGMHWLMQQDKTPAGYVVDRDANGDVVTDANGKVSRTQKWLVGSYPPAQKLTQDMVDDAKRFGIQSNLSTNDPLMTPTQYAELRHRIAADKSSEVLNDKLALDIGLTKEKLSELHQKQDFMDASTVFAHWVTGAGGDEKQALLDMKNHADDAAVLGPDGKPSPEALQAKQEYDLVQKAYGPDIIKRSVDEFNKEQLEQIKVNAADAKNKPLEVEGNASLTGPAYIASLPSQKQPVMKAFVNGQLGFPQLQRLLSGKEGQQFIEEAVLADPNINGAEIGELPKMVHNFVSGPESRAINAGATAIDSLKRLNDLSTLHSLMPGTDDNKRYNQQLGLTAVELAKFVIGGNGQPTQNEIHDQEKVLKTSTPYNRTSGILQAAKGIQDKYRQYNQTWQNGLPNQSWVDKYPLPGMSKEALANMNYLDNVGGGMGYEDAEKQRQQEMNGTAPVAPKATGPAGQSKSTVSVGGKPTEVIHNQDGTVTMGGQTYTVGKDRVTLTPVQGNK